VKEHYKESGVNWIGKIPAHWEIIKVKNLARNNGSLFIDGDWIESDVIQKTGVRYLTTGNIGPGKFKKQGNNYISEETFHSMNCLKALPGDLAISRLNEPIGRACILPYDEPRYVVAVDIVILRPDSKYDKQYISYCMNTVGYSENAAIMSRGTTMKRISRGGLGNFSIPITSYSEQKLISNFLNQKTSEIDTLIEDKEKLIQLLEEKRQAIITEAVTKGLDPDVQMKDSGVEWIGEIPEHWEVVKLKSKGEIRGRIGYRGYTTEDLVDVGKGAITLGASNINKLNQLDLSQKSFISWEKYYESPEIMVQTNDLIFVQRGSVGRFCIIEDKVENITINPSLLIIKEYIENTKHLYWYLNSNYITNLVTLLTTSTAVPMVSQEQLKNFNIILPPKQEQNKITGYLNHKTKAYDITVNIVNTQINKLKEYRQSLIYEAVTGKIDVQEMLKETEQEEVSSS